MNQYAHSKEGAAPSEWQSLEMHATAVADIAAEFAKRLNAEKWGWAVGRIHDMGKARKSFQDMLAGLRGKDADTQHAKYGAAASFTQGSLPLAFAIGGHHAGLHDLEALQVLVEGAEDLSLPPGFGFPDEKSLPFVVCDQNILALEFFTRMLFSCLIDADRLDSAFWEVFGMRTQKLAKPDIPLETTILLSRVMAERDRKRKANPCSSMGTIRNSIFDACVAVGDEARGFFSLTVPTGGGKTLAGMAFALAHARRHDLRRVIVVIPYLSIIEQNAAEYRRVLDPDNKGIVLECHSSVRPPKNATDEEVSRIDLVSENWDAPVIVTTSVQFLESLFAASPSRARKLHNIAESVVLFDEVQTLPTHLLAPVLSVFRELVANYGVSLVFSSATQPAFRQSPSLTEGFTPDEIREIVPESGAIYKELRRVDYIFESEPVEWDMLADRLAAEPQCLCVVNLTRHAYEVWTRLNSKLTDYSEKPPEKPLHLSSAMCPAHRLAVIRLIRRALKAGKPCRVVSTQLIEAGVDVDFPVVWRAMGPLDSIVQVAGRCNREGKPVRGKVHVFIPVDNKLPGGIYSIATGQAGITLAAISSSSSRTEKDETVSESLSTDPSVFTNYFSALFQLANTDGNDIQSDRYNMRFRSVAQKAVVIKDRGTPVVVPIGRARHVLFEIRNRDPSTGERRFTRDDLRSLQRYMVNVPQRDFSFFQQHKLLSPLLPKLDIFVIDIAQYNRNLGVMKPNQAPPLEDFLP